jgi:hypothetical protein
MPVAGGPKITTTGILLEVDAANASSYTSGSSTWVNVFRPGTRNGTINGTVGFSPTDNYGALTYPGTTSSYVDFGNIGDLSVSWSFQVAVKPAPSSSGNYTILSYASGSNTGSWTYKLDYSSSNQSAVLSVYSATGSARAVHQVTGSVPTGSWSIINASYGNSVVGMYVNGQPTDYTVTTGSTAGYNVNNRLYLGGTFGITSSYYTGSMASFFSYNTDVPNTQLVQNYNAYATRFGLPPSILAPVATDPDALRFIEIAEITNSTQAAAVNNLVTGLKVNSLWDKMVSVYPLVGGSAFSHKYNLKDPQLHPIRWFGAISHTSNGAELGNGGYGDVPTLNINTLERNNTSFSSYNKTTLVLGISTARSFVSSTAGPFHFGNSFTTLYGGYQYIGIFSTGEGLAVQNNTLGQPGYTIVSRINSSNFQVYFNSTVLYNASNTSVTPNSGIFEIGRAGAGWPGTTPQTSAFVTVGQGLSQLETTTLTNLVQAYQTTLGRQA